MKNRSIAVAIVFGALPVLAEPTPDGLEPERTLPINHIALTSFNDVASTTALLDQMASDGSTVVGTFGTFSFASALAESNESAVRAIAPAQFETIFGIPFD